MSKQFLGLVIFQVPEQVETEIQQVLTSDPKAEKRLDRETGVESVDCVSSRNHAAEM
jgi:hypothetical protein